MIQIWHIVYTPSMEYMVYGTWYKKIGGLPPMVSGIPLVLGQVQV